MDTTAIENTSFVIADSHPIARRRRGRPRKFDQEEVLKIALNVFWKVGFEAASLTMLTEAMSISRPSLYATFGNKEQLFRDAVALYRREKLGYLELALAAPTGRDVFEAIIRGAIDAQLGLRDPHGCLEVRSALVGPSANEAIKVESAKRRESMERRLSERFRLASEAGELPPGVSAEALGKYLSTVLQGMAVRAGAGAGRSDLEAIAEVALALWPTPCAAP